MAYKGPQVVIGPASATDNTVPRFDLTSGALIQGSSVVISDADAVSGVTQLDVDNIRVDGNTISSTDTNGNVVLAPDGDGTVSVTAAPIVPSTDRADSLGSATNSWDNVYADGLTFDDGTNVLDTYVDITSWTPSLEFGGASTGITYSFQDGSYVRMGNVAIIRLAMSLTSKGTATGNATITGFPLTMRTGLTQNSTCSLWNLINFTSTHSQVSFNASGGTSIFNCYQCGNNIAFAFLTDANFNNTSSFLSTFLFYVD